MEVLLTSEGIIALLTLTFLEIVLGWITSFLFQLFPTDYLSISKGSQKPWPLIGLDHVYWFALGISWIIGFTEPLFTAFEYEVSVKDLILIVGGLFLLEKVRLKSMNL